MVLHMMCKAHTLHCLELVSKYRRFSRLVKVNVYISRSPDSVGRKLRRHQKHAAATTTHEVETVQLH